MKTIRDRKKCISRNRGVGFLQKTPDAQTELVQTLTSLLNRLNQSNYADCLSQLRDLIHSARQFGDARPFLYQVVLKVSTKACMERSFIMVYVYLCYDLIHDASGALSQTVTLPDRKDKCLEDERQRFDHNDALPL